MSLSDTWLRTTLGKEYPKPFERTDRDGLSARVSAKGKITFQLRFWLDGKQCRLDVGTYPVMSLKQARDEILKYKADIAKGHDPRVTKQLEKRSNIEAVTVEKLFYQWHESYCAKNKKGHFEIKRSFEIHLLPVLGKFPVDKVTTSMWCDIFDKKVKESESIASRLLVNSKQMLSYAARRQIIPTNVLQAITAKADFNIVTKQTNRVLSNDEIKMLWLALDNSRTEHKNKLFIKLCLIYGCRNGELRLARREHFDFNDRLTWTVPAEHHKTGKSSGKPLIRPILPETKDMFLMLFALSGCDYLLTNGADKKPMSGSASVSLPYNLMQWLKKNQDYDMKHWSVHDLRRTARTNLSTLTQPHIAELMLGHKWGGVMGVYDHYDYYEEQLAAYTAWYNRIIQIVAG